MPRDLKISLAALVLGALGAAYSTFVEPDFDRRDAGYLGHVQERAP